MTNVRAKANRQQYRDPYADLAKLIEKPHPREVCAVAPVIDEIVSSIGRQCFVHRWMGDLSTAAILREPRDPQLY